MADRATRDDVRLDIAGLVLAGINNTILALLVALFVHGPGTVASQPDVLERAGFIAENAALWRAGWWFWFAPTLTFSWSYYALGRHLNGSRPWRNLAIGAALAAAAVDVVGILINITVLPDLAHALVGANGAGDGSLVVVFQATEKLANSLTNVGGYGLYSLAGLLLLPAAFSTTDMWRGLAWLGAVEWTLSIVATVLLVVAPALATLPLVISFLLYGPWVWGGAIWLWRRAGHRL